MRFIPVACFVSAIALVACSTPEAPETQAPPAPTAAAVGVPPAAKPKPPAAAPAATEHSEAAEGAHQKDIHCQRNEPGWKWVGNIVEEGKCVVGPCDCVRE